MLQLPHPMPHAIPRERSLDFYSPSRSSQKFDTARHMRLPMPIITPGHELDVLRGAPRPPLTPPSEMPSSSVRVVSLPPHEGAGHEYGYQLPAIGNSRTVTSQTSPTAQRHSYASSHDVSHQQRKKWTISPNLRIPSTISAPQEGLPQLAAEVSFTVK
jgi:hypothetical protein